MQNRLAALFFVINFLLPWVLLLARPDAADAVRACRDAGLHLLVLSGDHPQSLIALGARIGIIPPGELARQQPSCEPDESQQQRQSQLGFGIKTGAEWAVVHVNNLPTANANCDGGCRLFI